MTKLLLATANPGKAEELLRLLKGLPFPLTTLLQEGIQARILEDGSTFEENALKKARGYAALSGLLTLADDSGLEVEALGGEPGVLSARYAWDGASDEERVEYLLERLQGVPWEKRGARFRCVVAIATPQGRTWLAEGACDGIIATRPAGEAGFGYDPIFYLPELQRTMAQLTPEEKDRVSHRGKAVEKARELLTQISARASSS